MKIILIFFLINFSIISLKSCPENVNCSDSYTYPYFFCVNESSSPYYKGKEYCTSNPFFGVPYYHPYYVTLPLCINRIINTNDFTFYNYEQMNNQIVVTNDDIQNDLNDACNVWNCLCGADNHTSCGWHIKMLFTKKVSLWPDPIYNIAVTHFYWFRGFCAADDVDTIYYNNTNDFTQRQTGFIKKYWINENQINSSKLQSIKNKGYVVYSFKYTAVHEIGHVAGLDHYDNAPSPSLPCYMKGIGVMSSTQGQCNGYFSGLSNDDKCYFEKLYCPQYVPVKEDINNGNQYEINNYPNPFDRLTQIKFYVFDNLSLITIEIFDQLGQKVKEISKNCDNGYNTETIDCSDLQPGVYYYSISVDRKIITNKMLILR
jgi:hypothetical protein